MQIPKERILRSRDLTFHRDLLQATDGRGVDVVLNSVRISEPVLVSLANFWVSSLASFSTLAGNVLQSSAAW